MEDLRNDILELKKMYEEELDRIILKFCNRENDENHANVLLFKKKVNWYKIFITELDNLIHNNTPS